MRDSITCHLHPVKPVKAKLQKRNFSHSKNGDSQIANCEKWQCLFISSLFLKDIFKKSWGKRGGVVEINSLAQI